MALQMGKLIQQLRKQRGLTQEELGRGIVSKSVISRLENGMENPSVFLLIELFKKLDASLEPFEIVVSSKEYEDLKKLKQGGLAATVAILENDLLRDIRLSKGLSQEQLSRDICARETVSNIEHGRTPNWKKMRGLMERLGELPGRYFGYVDAVEYEVYGLVQQYQKQMNENPEEAKLLRQEIARRLDVKHPVNRQFLESSELLEKGMDGQLEQGELMAGLERCLRYTMPEYDGTIYRIPRRQEVIILEKIVECLRYLQRTEAAECLDAVIKEKNGRKLKIS